MVDYDATPQFRRNVAQNEKSPLRTIGASIAHEINNPLEAVTKSSLSHSDQSIFRLKRKIC